MAFRLVSLMVTCGIAAIAAPTMAQTAASQESSAEGADIIVTAQKRAERLIDTPVSVNSVNSEQLNRQSIYSLSDLSRSVPSLSSGLAIRGISTGGVSRSSQGAVAIVLDGVDTGPPSVGSPGISNLFDIERVEVLSGPQATLFGTTASAGVINVVTNKPQFDKFEIISRNEYGRYETVRNQLTVNVPLASNMAVRISGHNDETDGIVTNVLSNRKPYTYNRGVRGKLLWEPTTDLSISLIADYDRIGGNSERGIVYGIVPAGSSLEARLASCGVTASLSNRENCPAGINKITSKDVKYGFSGQLDYDLGFGTLTSITGYRRHKLGDLNYNGPGSDSDFLAQNILDTNLTSEDQKIFTQEVRISSNPGQKLEYTAGLFYFRKDQFDSVIQAGTLGDLNPLLAFLTGNPIGTVYGRVNLIDINQRTYAAFGQATYHLTDNLALIGGARYTHDKLSVVSQAPTDLSSYGYVGTLAFYIAPVDEQVTYNNFSWKLGAQYNFSRNLNAYFTATRGYKGPAVNDQSAPPIAFPVVQPEIPMNYEFGIKGAFLDNRVVATLAIFRNKVKNFQTSVYVAPSASSPQGNFAQGNAPFVKSEGVDFNVTARVTPELTLGAGFLYNRATYSSDFRVGCTPGVAPGTGNCAPLTDPDHPNTTSPVSQLAGTPKWRWLVNGQYETEITSGFNGFIQSDLTYESRKFASGTPLPSILDIRPQWRLNGRIGLRTTDGRWGLAMYGRNLLNKDYSQLGLDVLGGFNGGGGRSYWLTPAKRVEYGVTVDVRL